MFHPLQLCRGLNRAKTPLPNPAPSYFQPFFFLSFFNYFCGFCFQADVSSLQLCESQAPWFVKKQPKPNAILLPSGVFFFFFFVSKPMFHPSNSVEGFIEPNPWVQYKNKQYTLPSWIFQADISFLQHCGGFTRVKPLGSDSLLV